MINFRDRAYVMGIINVTPDSFSDGGLFFDCRSAVEHGLKLEDEGADIIDIGGESTRPGAPPISEEEEVRRVLPVLEALSRRIKIPISVDTYKAEVARRAINAGASFINDVSALRFDRNMPGVIRQYSVKVVLMHMLGRPQDMQVNPVYNDVVQDIYDFLKERIGYAINSGIRHDDIIIDPGLGFGKRLVHNLSLIKHLDAFNDLGCPILVGPSRKSFIGEVLNLPVRDRLEGTAAVAVVAIMKGATIIRVHDVKEMAYITKMVNTIQEA